MTKTTPINNNKQVNGKTLRECVHHSMSTLFENLDGQPTTDIYEMVMAEMEAPLLESVLHHAGGNQTRASEMLGLNRGTLRKKLKQYNLL